jgi:O-antigen/teichoic acid export membrane protein
MRETHDLSISGEVLIGLSSKVLTMGFGFAAFVLFARQLGPASLGGYLLVVAGARLVSKIARGTGTAIKKRASEANTDPRELFGLGILVQIGLVAATTAVLSLTAQRIQWYIEAPNLVISVVGIVGTLGGFYISQQFYQGLGYPGYSSWIDTIRSIVTTIAQVGLLLTTDLGSFALVIGLCMANGFSALIAVGLGRTWPAIPSRETIANVWRFGRWSVPDALVSDVYSRLDVLIIGAVVGNAAVAFYGTGLRLVQPAAFVAGSIGVPLMVRASGRHSRDMDVIHDLTNAVSYTSIIAIPIFFGSLAMPTAIVRTVFGEGFGAAAPAVVGLAAFQVVQTFGTPFTSVWEGIDRIDVEFKIALVVITFNIPLAIIAAYPYGLVGVIAATIAAELLRIVLYEALAYRIFDDIIFPRPVVEQIISGAVMFGVVTILADQVAVTGWLPLLALVSVGGVVYFGALFAVSRGFRHTTKSVIDEHFPTIP